MAVRGEEGDPIKTPIPNPHYYGTFSQPSPSPSPSAPLLYHPQQQHQPYHAIPVVYQSVAVQEGIPLGVPRLPFCGIGIGWALFIAGFFLAAIPWYIGLFILLFVAQDYREKPGLVACTIAAALVAMPFILRSFHEIFG